MTQAYSKSRGKAEIDIADAQSQLFARNSAVEELDSIVLGREEKTQRLSEARQNSLTCKTRSTGQRFEER